MQMPCEIIASWENLIRQAGLTARARCMLRAPSIEVPEHIPSLEDDEHKLRALADEFLHEKRNDRDLDFDRAMRRAAIYAAEKKASS